LIGYLLLNAEENMSGSHCFKTNIRIRNAQQRKPLDGENSDNQWRCGHVHL